MKVSKPNLTQVDTKTKLPRSLFSFLLYINIRILVVVLFLQRVFVYLCVLCHTTTGITFTEKTLMANATLEDVPSVDLMTELLRRLKCSSKPDKRLILVGNSFIFLSLCRFILSTFWFFFVCYSDPEIRNGRCFVPEHDVCCLGMLMRFLGFFLCHFTVFLIFCFFI